MNTSPDAHIESQQANPMDNMTLYEKKAHLIQVELDAMGMGRYQWYIWSLCGLGYFLDLLWAQAFGLIATPLQRELGFSDAQLGNIFTAFSSGLTAGAFVWGVLVDIIGRRWAFNGTVFITCVFGLVLGVPDTYTAILVLTAFNGFGIGGNIPIDTTICLEFIPKVCLPSPLSKPSGLELMIWCLESTVSFGFIVDISTFGCDCLFRHSLRIHPLPILRL